MESHLLQMRGLKLIRIVIMVDQLKSHLLQMRGLKHRPCSLLSSTERRIFYRCVD